MQNPAAHALRMLYAPPSVDPLRQEWHDAVGELDDDVSLEEGEWGDGSGAQVEELDEDGVPVVSAVSRASSGCILDAPGAVQVDNFTDLDDVLGGTAEATAEAGGGSGSGGGGYVPSALTRSVAGGTATTARAQPAHAAAAAQLGLLISVQHTPAGSTSGPAAGSRSGGGVSAGGGGALDKLHSRGGVLAGARAAAAATLAAAAAAGAASGAQAVETLEDLVRSRQLPGAGALLPPPPPPLGGGGGARPGDSGGDEAEFEVLDAGNTPHLPLGPVWDDPSVLPEPPQHGHAGGSSGGSGAAAAAVRAEVAAVQRGDVATLPGEPLATDSGADTRLVGISTSAMLEAMGLGDRCVSDESGDGDASGRGEGKRGSGGGGSGDAEDTVDLELDLTRGLDKVFAVSMSSTEAAAAASTAAVAAEDAASATQPAAPAAGAVAAATQASSAPGGGADDTAVEAFV